MENRKSNFSQCERIYSHMLQGRRLTQFEAIHDLGILRLSARIENLRLRGHDIRTTMIDVSNRWGEKCRVASYQLVIDNTKTEAA